MKRDLGSTPADSVWLRRETKALTGARFGVSDATFSTVRSQVGRALREARLRPPRVRRGALGPLWKPLDDALQQYWNASRTVRDTRPKIGWLQIALRRFMRWCETREIAPSAVSDEAITQFIDDDAQSALRGNIEERERHLRKAWNCAAREVSGWPKIRVATRRDPPGKPLVSFPEEHFTAAFTADLDDYTARRGLLPREPEQDDAGTHLERLRRRRAVLQVRMSDGRSVRIRRLRPLAEKSCYAHRRTLVMAATALVRSGLRQIDEITSIADVVCLEGAASLIDMLDERSAGAAGRTSYASSLVNQLISIAARSGLALPSEDLQAMHELAGELAAGVEAQPDTISPKNRGRLAQFDDPDNFALLVSCAEWEFDRLETERRARGRATKRMAVRAEAAVGALVLSSLPVRLRALATLEWQRNCRAPTRRGGNATITYFPDQSKVKRPQQVVLDTWKWRLLDTYWRHYRPLLNGADTSAYLFPGRTKTGHKTLGKLADAIIKFVRQRTGLVMNVHLWRHVMGAKLLEEHEDIRLVEELLGHVPGSRATRRYVELKTKWAAKRLDRITEGVRGRGRHLHRRRQPRPDRRRMLA